MTEEVREKLKNINIEELYVLQESYEELYNAIINKIGIEDFKWFIEEYEYHEYIVGYNEEQERFNNIQLKLIKLNFKETKMFLDAIELEIKERYQRKRG